MAIVNSYISIITPKCKQIELTDQKAHSGWMAEKTRSNSMLSTEDSFQL